MLERLLTSVPWPGGRPPLTLADTRRALFERPVACWRSPRMETPLLLRSMTDAYVARRRKGSEFDDTAAIQAFWECEPQMSMAQTQSFADTGKGNSVAGWKIDPPQPPRGQRASSTPSSGRISLVMSLARPGPGRPDARPAWAESDAIAPTPLSSVTTMRAHQREPKARLIDAERLSDPHLVAPSRSEQADPVLRARRVCSSRSQSRSMPRPGRVETST